MTTDYVPSTPPAADILGSDWRDPSLAPRRRAELLLSEMTIAEKVAQLGSVWQTDSAGDFAPTLDDAGSARIAGDFSPGLGQITRPFGTRPVTVAEGAQNLRRLQSEVIASNRFGIPAIAHEECLTGFAAYGATAYPTPLAWASSFDSELVGEMARAIGDDMGAVGIHQGLAPVLDVVRDYRWGRVEETMGEDPRVVGELGAAYVAGLESAGIIATLKHFAGYAASRDARNHGPVSMGPREFADFVLPPFETALRHGGARSVMNAYTDRDGVPAAADASLLTGLLRDEWGFEGTVVADYWAIPFLAAMHHVASDATSAGVMSLTAGLDVELPETTAYGAGLVELITRGDVDEALLDRSVLRHLQHKFEAGLLDGAPVVPADADSVDLDSARNRSIARRLAEESIIVLQSDSRIPLAAPQRIAVIGPSATDPRSLMGCYAFPNHVLAHHPGHDLGIAVPTVLDAIRTEYPDASISTEPGAEFLSDDESGIPAAVAAARAADVAVLVVGDLAGLFGAGTSGEGCDATDLRLPGGQEALVRAVLDTGVRTILIVVSGRPYALGSVSEADVIIQAFFPGAEGAGAIAGILSGRVSPSGRLPVQIPRSHHASATYLQPLLGLNAPGITVLDPTPLFPFGHGITAGDITYTGITVAGATTTDGAFEVAVALRNDAEQDAVEVVQLYMCDPVSQVVRPVVQLLAFARVTVPARSSLTVSFDVHSDVLSFTGLQGQRIVEDGEYVLSSGPSAGERQVEATIRLAGATRRTPRVRQLAVPHRVVEG